MVNPTGWVQNQQKMFADEGHPITPEPNQMLADVRGEQGMNRLEELRKEREEIDGRLLANR